MAFNPSALRDWFRHRYMTQAEWDPVLGTLLEFLGKQYLLRSDWLT